MGKCLEVKKNVEKSRIHEAISRNCRRGTNIMRLYASFFLFSTFHIKNPAFAGFSITSNV
jgi:hypothetical protein